MKIVRLTAVAVAAVIALSACTSPTELTKPTGAFTSSATPTEASVSTSGTSTPAVVPTASPTATVAAAAVVTSAGYGDLKLNRPVPANSALVHWVANWCYPKGKVPKDFTGSNGRWIPNGYKGTSTDFSSRPDFFVTTAKFDRDSPITWILISSPKITTKSGAHVGTSGQEIEKLFPSATKSVRKDPSITLYSVHDSAGQVVFDAGSDQKDLAHSAVEFIHVIPTSEKPFSIQYSEHPNCFS